MVTVAGVEATVIPNESHRSAVSWAAIAAGAVAACAFSLFLSHLLAGLGLLAVSPWPGSGVSATTFKVSSGIALLAMAVMASALGGYLAGRLRTRWVGIHGDETYFRDTAHGLATWAFATILTASVLASAAAGLASSVTQGVTAGATANASTSGRNDYYTDLLFRSDKLAQNDNQAGIPEASRLLTRAVTPGVDLAATDRARLAQLVAMRTGITQQEAEQRVDAVVNQARAAADDARKAAAKLALWLAAALLAGGLAAGIGAVEGGRERDA